MKNRKVMKRVLVIAIVAAIAGGSIGTGVYVQRAKMTAEVMSVADLNSGYWGDDVNSSGMITNDYSQSVEITNTDEIKEVYVKEGQQVQKGDKLLELDLEYLKANAPSLCSPILCTELEDNQKVRLLASGEIKAGAPLYAIDIYEA